LVKVAKNSDHNIGLPPGQPARAHLAKHFRLILAHEEGRGHVVHLVAAVAVLDGVARVAAQPISGGPLGVAEASLDVGGPMAFFSEPLV
jgi:hypothetical protein